MMTGMAGSAGAIAVISRLMLVLGTIMAVLMGMIVRFTGLWRRGYIAGTGRKRTAANKSDKADKCNDMAKDVSH